VNSGKQQAESGNSICRFPENFDDVLALPGIGRYTAGAICSIAFNQPVPILDGNVIRVLTRLFGIAENPKDKKTNQRLWQLAEELVNEAHSVRWGERSREPVLTNDRHFVSAREDARPTNCSHLNQSLMELGALICTPRSPQCLVCPVKKFCVAFKANRTTELPNLGKREAATARHFIAFAIQWNGKFLVQQRPSGVVNAQLWEFPNLEITGTKPDTRKLFVSIFGITPPRILPLCTVKHSITRYRITLEAFHASLGGASSMSPFSITKTRTRGTRTTKTGGVWKTPAQLPQLAFTAAHKKLASAAVKSILSGR
jgi:A/G-specific adenine glycosylase